MKVKGRADILLLVPIPGTELVKPHGDPLVLYPGFLDKTDFP